MGTVGRSKRNSHTPLHRCRIDPMKNLSILVVLALSVVAVACSTRINQTAGGNASVSITTSTKVTPSTAVGTNPVASVDSTRIESR